MVLTKPAENDIISGMKTYHRVYTDMIREHLSMYRQMIFLSGPRQVGKTTLAKGEDPVYFSWDREEDRRLILAGGDGLSERIGIGHRLGEPAKLIAFDEIHRYPRWKTFLKGFFDVHEKDVRIIATGSARMDVYKRGGDSMMGRYFPYRIHPLSVAEITDPTLPDEKKIVRSPRRIPDGEWAALYTFGGFPEPFAMRNVRFARKWQELRLEQLLRTDVRDVSRSLEIDRMESLARILINRSGDQLVYSSLARDLNVTEPTVKQWISTLKSLYFGFEVRPYFKNIENSIRKMPKWYMRDWSLVDDEGKRAETMVACHLLKAVEAWTDLGFGEFSLSYIRDKMKREVDFIVVRDQKPWFLVEVKKRNEKLSTALCEFQRITGAGHAFQTVLEEEYVDEDCFAFERPVIVPAKTFLSQLM